MKLVSAKCPNCGAAIDVDKDSDSTKCEFCHSKIIVDDAIAKYKIEISGEVELKNMPKIDNLLKLADMHYKDREYSDAYTQYSKACELDPSNTKALLRKGLCKTYMAVYPKFDIVSSVNAFKNTYKLFDKTKDVEAINDSIAECNNAIIMSAIKIDNYVASHIIEYREIDQIKAYFVACLNNQEYLYSLIINNEDLEIAIINSMFKVIDFILKGKNYNAGLNQYGKPVVLWYRPPKVITKQFTAIKNKYNVRYNFIMNKKR